MFKNEQLVTFLSSIIAWVVMWFLFYSSAHNPINSCSLNPFSRGAMFYLVFLAVDILIISSLMGLIKNKVASKSLLYTFGVVLFIFLCTLPLIIDAVTGYIPFCPAFNSTTR